MTSARWTNIAIHGQLADLPERKVPMRPHLGHVEDVPSVLFCLLWLHDLYINIPDRVISLFDGFKQVLNQKIGVFSSESGGSLLG